MPEQALPVPNERRHIVELVVEDLHHRREVGIERYGTALQAFNGRSALRDLYEELLDAVQYTRQVIEEDSFPLMLCNAGCGCRIPSTEYRSDADARDCACGGPCQWDTWEQFMADVLNRPEEYQMFRQHD